MHWISTWIDNHRHRYRYSNIYTCPLIHTNTPPHYRPHCHHRPPRACTPPHRCPPVTHIYIQTIIGCTYTYKHRHRHSIHIHTDTRGEGSRRAGDGSSRRCHRRACSSSRHGAMNACMHAFMHARTHARAPHPTPPIRIEPRWADERWAPRPRPRPRVCEYEDGGASQGWDGKQKRFDPRAIDEAAALNDLAPRPRRLCMAAWRGASSIKTCMGLPRQAGRQAHTAR
jgi:hypothetical protein